MKDKIQMRSWLQSMKLRIPSVVFPNVEWSVALSGLALTRKGVPLGIESYFHNAHNALLRSASHHPLAVRFGSKLHT